MAHLILPGDNTLYPGFSLLGESTLAITLDETGIGHFEELPFLVLSGTTSVSIASTGAAGALNQVAQLAEKDNVLTTVTISDSNPPPAVFFFSVGLPSTATLATV